MATTTEPAGVWLSIPDGYAALPLTDIPQTIAATGKLLAELGTSEQRRAGQGVLGVLEVLLELLAGRRAAYCGVGRHRSALDGRIITSSLVVTVVDVPEQRNPRLVLRDLLLAKAAADEAGQADLVDLANGPALFVEQTRTLPVPAGRDGVQAPVWQLEAFVPSPEGDRLATVEVSTPFAEHGPQYRTMVVTMAAGVAFRPPATEDPLAALLG